MSRRTRLGLAALVVAVVIGHPGCSLLFQVADPVDNVHFDGCFQRVIDNPDGTQEATRLTLIAGEKPAVSGDFTLLEVDAAQNILSREDYAVAGEATAETEAELTAAPTMGTPGAEQDIRVTRNLSLDSAQIEMSEADGRSFTALIRCPEVSP